MTTHTGHTPGPWTMQHYNDESTGCICIETLTVKIRANQQTEAYKLAQRQCAEPARRK